MNWSKIIEMYVQHKDLLKIKLLGKNWCGKNMNDLMNNFKLILSYIIMTVKI